MRLIKRQRTFDVADSQNYMVEHCSLLQIVSTLTAFSPLNKRTDRRRRHVCGPGPWLARV
jgi:hypothetical protein